MKLEHVALNVADPNACGRWYVTHLGFKIVRRFLDPPYGHFLADDSGTMMLEIYGNPDFPLAATAASAPPTLHLAFVSTDVAADVQRLVGAGATLVGQVDKMPSGDVIAMLRDPWGVPIQFVKRAQPMI